MSSHEKGGSDMVKKIDHIGIAVKDLEDSLRMYKEVYGLNPIKIETLADINVRIAFIPLCEVLIELLEPTAPGAGRIGKFIEEQGEGFHHIAFRVEDIDRAMEKLRKTCVLLRDQKPRDGGDESRIAFIEPTSTQNVLTELVERKREVKGD
jgi:methylmalonyl-CoA/ethylmalonyl-CoA epimerase